MEKLASSLLATEPDLEDHELVRLLLVAAAQDRAWLVGDPTVAEEVAERFCKLVARRRRGEPLQYIEEIAAFGPIEVKVDRRALIPRPETERLWELAVDAVRSIDSPNIVDLCTGGGNVALALKHTYPEARIVGVDVSADAVALAEENAARLGLDVEFRCGDLFAGLPAELGGEVDLVVSNPPYVTTEEYRKLPEEIVAWEPRLALVAGEDGLDVLSRIADEADQWLQVGGRVICEIGEGQGEACRRLFSRYAPETRTDLTGRDRFVLGTAPHGVVVH